ncbi:Ring finger protein [Pandoravirus salinus]|uniref:Ring finger protein n=1 Tax=Pandoravirus salinus TaxID=1349410 RepID=S4W3A3_9VIRU|nr:Ring domain [Pandoravirus salinus]AGO84725.1 Ring finger protein [Pandoravirus salinus]
MYLQHRPDVGTSGAAGGQDRVFAWPDDVPRMAAAKEQAWPDACPVCCDAPAFYKTACRHAFCLDCLRRLATDDGGRISCPLCRSPVVLKFYKNRIIEGAENGGRPAARQMLAFFDTRPDDVLSVLARDTAVLFRALEQHPAEVLAIDATSQSPPHFLPGAFALSLRMTRLADRTVPHALQQMHTVNAPHPIESLHDCRLTFKPATTRLVDVASVTDHIVASVADALGIYYGMRNVLRHMSNLGLPETVVFRHLHPLQTTVTMTDGTVMNLLQYAVIDLLDRHEPDAVRRWLAGPMNADGCPSLVRTVAGHPHPRRREQEAIIAALLSVRAGLSSDGPPSRWDHEFDKILHGDPVDAQQDSNQSDHIRRFVDAIAAVDHHQDSCDDCSAVRHEPKHSITGQVRTVHPELLANVARAVRPTVNRSCLSDDGWMTSDVIMDQTGHRTCDVDRALDYLIDCSMVVSQERHSCDGDVTWYRYVGQ